MHTVATVTSDLAVGAVERSADGRRVRADVDGFPLFFESSDADLFPSAEAFAGAFVLPALHFGRNLLVSDAVEADWVENVGKLAEIFYRWWDYPPASPVVASQTGPETAVPSTGACFSGGVDSFYTQLRGAQRSDHLVFVHGFDIDADDTARAAAFEPNLRRVAAELGKCAVIVRTNLRRHPLYQRLSWERTHGAALAAAGHVLCGTMGSLVIPSSYAYGEDAPPWGSHWETDPLWSSSRMKIIHDDATFHRRAKLRAIAHEPILHENLRVCWENLSASGNCSRCEKCVRTMTVLAGCGVLERFSSFDRSVSLPTRLDALPAVPSHLLYVYEAFQKDDLPADVKAAVNRLVARARRANAASFLRRAAHRIAQFLHVK